MGPAAFRAIMLLMPALVLVFFIPAAAQPQNQGPPPCSDGSQPTCPGGVAPTGNPPSCTDGSTPTCSDGSTPSGGDQQQPGGGEGGGNGTPQSTSPHAASMLGDVAHTTVAGVVPGTTTQLPVGENIYGPFEAGFTQQQENIIRGLGCTTPENAYVNGGIDTKTAEQHMAQGCNIVLPRWENGQYVSLLDQCGGHTQEYHFHERLSCLYTNTTGGHSPKVGETSTTPKQPLYGKWEHDTNEELPLLDACGAHYGPTPESPSADVYHYHVQDNAPFTIGCFGPNDDNTMVTVQQCRDFYTGCDGTLETVTTSAGSIQYDNWCPCYDAAGLNSGTGISELLVFRVVPGSVTMTVADTVNTCASSFQDSVKTSLAAAASQVSSTTYTAADIVGLKVSGCSSRRLSGSASLRRLAQVDVSYKIKAADVAAASSLATAASTSSQSFTSTFSSTMQTDGITVTSPQLTPGTVVASSGGSQDTTTESASSGGSQDTTTESATTEQDTTTEGGTTEGAITATVPSSTPPVAAGAQSTFVAWSATAAVFLAARFSTQ